MMIYQLKIQLDGITAPPVWRRILIPCNASFDDLHKVIQAVFGWQDYHLHHFTEKPVLKADGNEWRISDDEEEDMMEWGMEFDNYKAKDTAIAEFLNPMCPKICYTYDFGDDWDHIVTLEDAFFDKGANTSIARCIEAKGITPPEDCGGLRGFLELRDFINANPDKSILAARGQLPEQELIEDELGLGAVAWACEFFNVINDKPEFSKIELEPIQEELSKIKLSKIRFKSLNQRLSELQSASSKRYQRSKLTEADKDEIRDICRKVVLEIFGLTPNKK